MLSLCAASDRWESVSRDQVECDFFSFVTSFMQGSMLSYDETKSGFYAVLFMC